MNHIEYLQRAKKTLSRIGKRGSAPRVEFEMRWAKWIDKTGKSDHETLVQALDRVDAHLDKHPAATPLELSTDALWGGVDNFLAQNRE